MEGVERSWYGMPPAPIPWCPPAPPWPREKQEQEAEKNKKAKYSHSKASHHLVLVAVESLGVFGPEAWHFFRDLSQQIQDTTLEPLSHHYLIQQVAVAVQWGNAAAILGSSGSDLLM